MSRWVVATGNAHKLQEMQEIVADTGVRLVAPSETGVSLDPEEWGTRFATNAAIKAIAWARATGLTALADDSGLEVDALDGAPGVFSSRWAGPAATDADNVSKLLATLGATPDAARTARFRCVVALARPAARGDSAASPASLDALAHEGRWLVDGAWDVELASGTLEGRIAHEVRGAGGFGYDPVFALDDGRHLSELTSAEKNAISHRGRALRRLLAQRGGG